MGLERVPVIKKLTRATRVKGDPLQHIVNVLRCSAAAAWNHVAMLPPKQHTTVLSKTMIKFPRHLLIGAIGLLVLWVIYLGGQSHLHLINLSLPASPPYNATAPDTGKLGNPPAHNDDPPAQKGSPLSPHVHTYFDQVFAVGTPPTTYTFPAIQAACARTEWREKNADVYLKCGGMSAGMTSILSQVKGCFKMAIDAGINIVLPAMPLRASDDLTNFNILNASAYMTYDEWFDLEQLTTSMASACPKMKIRHPNQMKTPAMPVANDWSIDISTAPEYEWLAGYFWPGRPFKSWFDGELSRLRSWSNANTYHPAEPGATIIDIASQFLIYRITDDATGRDLALWNDISHLIKFKEAPRVVTAKVLSLMDGRAFFGIHFRVESDNIWAAFETQLERDLDALDKVWSKYGAPDRERPLLYLACGDETQIDRFSEVAKPLGWTVASKYHLVTDKPELLAQLQELPFDFQGAIDYGIMLKSHFFIGITGSAFSSTVANMRDVVGRYRGSSILFPDDGNARTHLVNDGGAKSYPCCL